MRSFLAAAAALAAFVMFAPAASAGVCPTQNGDGSIQCTGSNTFCGASCVSSEPTCSAPKSLNCGSCSCACPGGTVDCGATCVSTGSLSCAAGQTPNYCAGTCTGNAYVVLNPGAAQTGATSISGDYNGAGQVVVTGNIKSTAGDVYLATGKALRIDGAGTATLNVGNWGAGASGLNMNVGGSTLATTFKVDGQSSALDMNRSSASFMNRFLFSTAGVNDWQVGELFVANSFVIKRITSPPDVGTTSIYIDGSDNIGIGNIQNPSSVLDMNGALTMRGAGGPGVSPGGQGRIYFDAGTNKFKISENGTAYVNVLGSSVTASGTPAIGQAAFWTSAGGAIGGDNGFFWDNTNKRLGIGTATPTQPLSVGSTSQFNVDSGGNIAAPSFSGGAVSATVGGFGTAIMASGYYGISVSTPASGSAVGITVSQNAGGINYGIQEQGGYYGYWGSTTGPTGMYVQANSGTGIWGTGNLGGYFDNKDQDSGFSRASAYLGYNNTSGCTLPNCGYYGVYGEVRQGNTSSAGYFHNGVTGNNTYAQMATTVGGAPYAGYFGGDLGTTATLRAVDVAASNTIRATKNGFGYVDIDPWVGSNGESITFNDAGTNKANLYYNRGSGNFLVNSVTPATNTVINANGGNVGIGTASPAQKLDITGSVIAQNNTASFWGNVIEADSSTMAGGSLIAATKSNNGTNGDLINLQAGSTPANRFRVTSTGQIQMTQTNAGTNGSLNIVTDTMANPFNISKAYDISVTDSTTGTGGFTALSVAAGFSGSGTGTKLLADFLAGSNHVVIDPNGRLGIGDTTPAEALTVGNGDLFRVNSSGVMTCIQGNCPPNGAIRLTPNLHLNAGAGYAVIANWDNGTTGGSLAFRVGNGAGSDVFDVLANGNTGIGGITAPADALDVNGWLRLRSSQGIHNDYNRPVFQMGWNGYYGDFTSIGPAYDWERWFEPETFTVYDTGFYWAHGSSGTPNDGCGEGCNHWNWMMRLEDMYAENSTAIANPAKLFVNGAVLAGQGGPSCTAYYSSGYSFYRDGCYDTGMFSGTDGQLNFYTNSTLRLQYTLGGAFAYNNSEFSDERIKENIKPYTDGLATLKKVNAVSFTYNGLASSPKGEKAYGVIAQEIQKIMPYAVKTTPERLRSTDMSDTDILAVDMQDLTMLSINAIKDLDALTVKKGDPWGDGTGWLACSADGDCSCPDGTYMTKVNIKDAKVYCNKL